MLSVKSPDPEYIAKATKLLELLDQAGKGEIVLLYEDEVDLKPLPGVIGRWTERGKQHKVALTRVKPNYRFRSRWLCPILDLA